MFIQEVMRISFEQIFHIADSEIVKAMISKSSYGFNTFAANRIGEIQEGTVSDEWYWTPGKLNIADWVTRGKRPSEIGSGSKWQSGPEFLQKPISEWPISQTVNVKELPDRTKQVYILKGQSLSDSLANRIDLERFSKLEYYSFINGLRKAQSIGKKQNWESA